MWSGRVNSKSMSYEMPNGNLIKNSFNILEAIKNGPPIICSLNLLHALIAESKSSLRGKLENPPEVLLSRTNSSLDLGNGLILAAWPKLMEAGTLAPLADMYWWRVLERIAWMTTLKVTLYFLPTDFTSSTVNYSMKLWYVSLWVKGGISDDFKGSTLNY